MLLTQRVWRGALLGNIAVSTRKKKKEEGAPVSVENEQKDRGCRSSLMFCKKFW
ncbi:MAG: hypothetical protein ACI8ZB_005252 [Desulforhopalus sp.]|jgi:hypothetical protein